MHFKCMNTEPDTQSENPEQAEAQWRSKKRVRSEVLKHRSRPLNRGLLLLLAFSSALLGLTVFDFISPTIAATANLVSIAIYAIAAHVLSLKTGSSSKADAPSAQTLKLAERLETLEDQSWEIRESEDIHRSASEAFGDVVIHRNGMGNITFSNSVFAKYFDDPSQLPDFQIGTFDETGANLVRDVEVVTKLGPRWFAWADLVIRDFDTGDSGTRSIGRDITERKQHEKLLETKAAEALQASDTKSRFLGMVSHEIRTPLSGILGMTKLLQDSKLTSTQSDHLQAIETSGQTLLTLIEDLLDQAQLETGHMIVSKSPTNLVRLVEDVCELLSDHARQKNITIASHVDARISDCVSLDGARLKQVLVNLAGNALKFTDSGGVAINVRLEKPDHEENPTMCVSVKDSGPGIAPQDIEKIFNAFAQVDSGANRPHEGAGLGLAISQDIVGLMGGKIEVDSQLGEGTIFQFNLPLEPTEIVEPVEDKIDCVILAMPQTPARDAITQTAYQYCRKVITANSIKNLDLIAATCPKSSVVVVDSAFDVSPQWVDDIRNALGQSTRVLCLEAARGETRDQGDSLYDGWLTWPVRSNSLKNALYNQLGQESADTEKRQTKIDINMQSGKSLNILLAEDNPINTLLATSLLGKLGHRVTHAENGEKAYEFFARNHPASSFDVVLMDLHMPVCDGTTSIRSIRKYESNMGLGKTPIVVLSADNQDVSQTNALDAGADDFLLKPLDFDDVAKILSNFSNDEIEISA